MKKILQAFKKLFKRKEKQEIYYICDPNKATRCSKEGCWYLMHGPCKCTKKKSQAKVDKRGRYVIATVMDIWNEEYREWCLEHPDMLMRE